MAFACESEKSSLASTAESLLSSARTWLDKNSDQIDCIIFCAKTESDYEEYRKLMQDMYFPLV